MEEEVGYELSKDDIAAAVGHLEGKWPPIKFKAEVKKVQTTVDGGIRLTLDLPEKGRAVMSELAKCQQTGVYLAIEATKDI